MHLFNNEAKKSLLNNIKESIRIEGGEVHFRVNTGKGSGEQGIPLDQFRPVVEALKGYVDAGVGGPSTAESPVETLKRTIGYDDDGAISFRLTNGKGSKPVKVSPADFAPVVSLLEACLIQIEKLSQK